MAVRLDKWWLKSLIIPILTLLPAAIGMFIIKSAAKSGTGSAAKPDAGIEQQLSDFQFLFDFASDHPLLSVIYISLYLILINAIVEFIRSKDKIEDGVEAENLLKLFGLLEKIVSFKAARFGACAKRVCTPDTKADPVVTFQEITQPDQQIVLLIDGLHAFFDAIDKEGVSFKITVAVIEKNLPVDWLYFKPEDEPPRTPFGALQEGDSAISHCLERKRLVIIEDIEKEAAKGVDRHYIPRLSDEDEDGSLICYPIMHHYTGCIPYVITIVADKRHYFEKSKADLYKWIFKHFALRIGLEHSLMLIKKGCKK